VAGIIALGIVSCVYNSLLDLTNGTSILANLF